MRASAARRTAFPCEPRSTLPPLRAAAGAGARAAQRAQALVVARPQRLEPAGGRTRSRLRLADDERARAEVEDVRLRRVEPDLGQELLARERLGRRSNHSSKSWRAGGDDVAARDPVQLDRLASLGLVPDEHPLGDELEQALVRQVVPARDGDRRRGSPSAPRALQELDLVGAVLHDRRDHDDVGRAARGRSGRSPRLVGIACLEPRRAADHARGEARRRSRGEPAADAQRQRASDRLELRAPVSIRSRTCCSVTRRRSRAALS